MYSLAGRTLYCEYSLFANMYIIDSDMNVYKINYNSQRFSTKQNPIFHIK